MYTQAENYGVELLHKTFKSKSSQAISLIALWSTGSYSGSRGVITLFFSMKSCARYTNYVTNSVARVTSFIWGFCHRYVSRHFIRIGAVVKERLTAVAWKRTLNNVWCDSVRRVTLWCVSSYNCTRKKGSQNERLMNVRCGWREIVECVVVQGTPYYNCTRRPLRRWTRWMEGHTPTRST